LVKYLFSNSQNIVYSTEHIKQKNIITIFVANTGGREGSQEKYGAKYL